MKPEPLKVDPPEYDVYRDGGPPWSYALAYLLIVLPVVALIIHKWSAL